MVSNHFPFIIFFAFELFLVIIFLIFWVFVRYNTDLLPFVCARNVLINVIVMPSFLSFSKYALRLRGDVSNSIYVY